MRQPRVFAAVVPKGDLAKSRQTGSKNKGTRNAFGYLTSQDPSFYPGAAHKRYLTAGESPGVLIAKYSKKGVAVLYVPPAGMVTHPGQTTVKPPVVPKDVPTEDALADGVVEGMAALHEAVDGGELLHPEAVAALPNIDIDPALKPMSYLLSLGWGLKDEASGRNVFTKKETERLLQESLPSIKAAVVEVSAQQKVDPHTRQELQSEAALFLLEAAQMYDAAKRPPPGPKSNFAAWLNTSLKHRLADKVRKERKRGAVHKKNEQAILDRAQQGRIETPEQYARRKELGVSVSGTLADILSGTERAVVVSRLNILNHQVVGISDDALDSGVKVGGLKPWQQVKDDILAHIKLIEPDRSKQAEIARIVQNLKPEKFKKVFDGAMEKLQNDVTGITSQDRQQLAELAGLHRMAMEGVRHETFDHDEMVGRLNVLQETPTTDHLGSKEVSATADLEKLSLEEQTKAFLTAYPELAKQLGLKGAGPYARRYYGLLRALAQKSTDQLRSMVAAPRPPNKIPAEHWAVMLRWAMMRSINKSLCVIPDLSDAWARLHEECAVWDANGR